MDSVTFADLVALLARRHEEPPEPEPRVPERHDLTDEEWVLIQPLLPEQAECGRSRRDDRQVLDGMLHVLRTGCPWRDLPPTYGPWKTVYNRFNRWRQEEVLDRVAEGLLGVLEQRGSVDWHLWCLDGSNTRAARCAAGARKKGAPTTSRKTMRLVVREAVSARSSTS